MKKFIIFIVLSTGSLVHSQYSGGAFAQNPAMPSEPCLIVLKNNKLIKDARLWEIYPDRVEYEQEGSLHDLFIEEIERIETNNEIITFEPDGKLFKQPYDLIILHPGSTLMQKKEGDTIKCSITKVTDANIYYYRKEKRQKETYVPLVLVKRFVRNGVEHTVREEESSVDKRENPSNVPIFPSKEGYNETVIEKTAYSDRDSIKGMFLIDHRDGQKYKIVEIGTQTWMAENLNYDTGDSWCYKNKSSYCVIYGRLYTWDAAKNACPTGWHLPSDTEWHELESYTGLVKKPYKKGWRGKHGFYLNLGGESGFNALDGGFRRSDDGKFFNLGNYGFYWTNSKYNESNALYIGFRNIEERVRFDPINKKQALSVRCIKD